MALLCIKNISKMISENILFIIAFTILCFLIVYYLGKKAYLFKRNLLIKSIIFSMIIGPFMYFTFSLINITFQFREKQDKFNIALWKKDKYNQYTMADDLIKSKILINADYTTIIDFFGKPDSKTKDFWRYYLGTGGGIGFRDHFLIINFKYGKVQNIVHERIED